MSDTPVENELAKANARIRRATQRLVEVTGADGPMDLEDAIERILQRVNDQGHGLFVAAIELEKSRKQAAINPLDCGAKIFLCRECVRCLQERLKREEADPRHVTGAQWYSIDPEEGADFWNSEEEAQRAAEMSLEHYRDKSTDGWHQEVESIEWGLVIPYQSASQVNRREAGEGSEFDYVCDYELVTVR